MPLFPNSTGNFVFTKGTRDKFDFYLLSDGNPIDLTSTAVTMRIKHSRFATTINSFSTNATSPRLTVLNTTSGAVRFQPLSGDIQTIGQYRYYFEIWDVNSDNSFVPEHLRYNMTVLDVF